MAWHLVDDIGNKKMLEGCGKKKVRPQAISTRWFVVFRNIASAFKHPKRSFKEACFAMHYMVVHKEKSLSYSQLGDDIRTNEKIFLIASPCSGKSYFVRRNHGRYKEFRIVDESDLVEDTYDPNMSEEENLDLHNQRRVSFLRDSQSPTCLISTLLGLENFDHYDGVMLAAVLIPKWKVVRYWISRRPFGYYKWSDLENIVAYRQKILDLVEKEKIPLYPSFEVCLNRLS